MSSSPAVEPSHPIPPASTPVPSSPALRTPEFVTLHASTPNYTAKKHQHAPLNVTLPAPAPTTPPTYGEPTLTPPPRSPGGAIASGDSRTPHPPDGTSSDKSSETAVGVPRTPNAVLSRKESYKAQRQHYRREKKRATSALLHSIEDPAVVVLADWLKVRGSLKSWTKLWCVLKPGLLLLYKSPKAKSSHWVGTVLLTSCQVIERPSKKDGFCFKLYHPLEQSIWAPRGPHNETIGAVVQPLPTAHLIFRAPSQAAGHCWLDGLELALRCSNAMLRCSRNRQSHAVADAPTTPTHISHEELEKHFNEHVLKLSEVSNCRSPTPLMSVSDYSPKRHSPSDRRTKKLSKWSQFMDNFEHSTRDTMDVSTGSQTPDFERTEKSFLDFHFLKNIDFFERNVPSTSSLKGLSEAKLKKNPASKSLASSPKLDLKKSPLLRCFEMPKSPVSLGDKSAKVTKEAKASPATLIEENITKLFLKRRSSTPCVLKRGLAQKRISELRESGAKTDSENDDSLLFKKRQFEKRQRRLRSQVVCDTPENILITTTAPSGEVYREYSSSSTDDVGNCDVHRTSPAYFAREHLSPTPDKFALIDYRNLPSAGLSAMRCERRDERVSSQSVYVAGKIVQTGKGCLELMDVAYEFSRAPR